MNNIDYLKTLPHNIYIAEMLMYLFMISLMSTLLSFGILPYLRSISSTSLLYKSTSWLGCLYMKFITLFVFIFLRCWYISWPFLGLNLYLFPSLWVRIEYYPWRMMPFIFLLTLCIWYWIWSSYFNKFFFKKSFSFVNYCLMIGIFCFFYNIWGSWVGPYNLFMWILGVTIGMHGGIWFNQNFISPHLKNASKLEVVKLMPESKTLTVSFLYTSLCVFGMCFLYLLMWRSLMMDIKYVALTGKMYSQMLQWFYLTPEILCLLGIFTFPLLDRMIGLFTLKTLPFSELKELKARTFYWILMFGFTIGLLWICFYWHWSSDITTFMQDKTNPKNLSAYKWGLYFPGDENRTNDGLSLKTPLQLFNDSFIYDTFSVAIKDFLFMIFLMMIWFTKSKFISFYHESGVSFYITFLFLMLGTFMLVSIFDFLTLFLSFELMNFSSYILIIGGFSSSSRGKARNIESAIKYYLIGGLGSIFIGIGIAFFLFLFGSTNFLSVAVTSFNIDSLDQVYGVSFKLLTTGIFFIFLMGLFFKLGVFPGHTWLADIYAGLSWFVLIIIAVPVKLAVAIMLMRIIEIFSNEGWLHLDYLKNFLLMSAAGSLLVGTFYAVQHSKLKPFFAYSSVSQSGVFMLGLSTLSFWGYFSSLFFMVGYMLTALNFLLIITLMENHLNYYKSKIIYLTDLFIFTNKFRFPNLYLISLALCLFSFGGMPPLYGFFAKFNILINALYNEYYLISLLFILTSILSIYYYIKLFIISFIENNKMQIEKFFMTNSTLHNYNFFLMLGLTHWMWLWLLFCNNYFNSVMYRFTYFSICMFHNVYFAA